MRIILHFKSLFKFIVVHFFILLITTFIVLGRLAWAQYDAEIKIDQLPFLQKIPVAVPIFKPLTGNANEVEIASSASKTLYNTLEYTGYFKIIDRAAFLEEPRQTGILAGRINFHNWTSIGAELLVTGGVKRTGKDGLYMELRLFDTFKSRIIFGKGYTGKTANERSMIHKFCSDLIYRFTGSRGLFNSKIAFVSTTPGNKSIYICDFDGYDIKRFTNNKSINLSPAWSSDGKWLAYTSYRKGKPDLFIRHLSQKRGYFVAEKGTNITPAWVPGQFQLAASLSFSGDPEIYLLTGSGKRIKRLTHKWGIDVSPTFSPDGKKMAFVSKRSGTPQIYVKNLASGRVERITFRGNYNTTPSWSPRGDKIAYSSTDNGKFNIYVIDINKKVPTQMTDNAGDNESPSWSPDGSLIAFSSTREGPNRIYFMTAYGTDQRRLLTMPGEQTNPKWSPQLVNK